MASAEDHPHLNYDEAALSRRLRWKREERRRQQEEEYRSSTSDSERINNLEDRVRKLEELLQQHLEGKP